MFSLGLPVGRAVHPFPKVLNWVPDPSRFLGRVGVPGILAARLSGLVAHSGYCLGSLVADPGGWITKYRFVVRHH